MASPQRMTFARAAGPNGAWMMSLSVGYDVGERDGLLAARTGGIPNTDRQTGHWLSNWRKYRRNSAESGRSSSKTELATVIAPKQSLSSSDIVPGWTA